MDRENVIIAPKNEKEIKPKPKIFPFDPDFQYKRCIDCGELITEVSERCKACEAYRESRYKKPDRDTLKDLLRHKGIIFAAKEYGCQYHVIRQWCEQYGLPQYDWQTEELSDEEWEEL